MERLSAGDPRWIGDYRLLGRLGEGGMGRVYLARSQRGRTIAVKVVQNELARQPDFRRRFAQEITAARRVGGTWTAPVLDADTEAETPWVATGYIAGPSLAEVVDDQYGPLPAASVEALASGLTRALRDIHGADLVHRDLKPSNVLITIDGPRVIDFGIARALDSAVQSAGGLTRTGALVGSPGFMSPEQVRGQHVTPACDVFCLGAVLAYAATGRMPFGTSDSGVHALLFRIAEEEPDLTGLSGQLLDLVAACLAKDPEKRPDLDTLISRTEGELSGTWLPGEVLAQLGRHAVQLLDSEDPEGETHGGAGVAAGVAAGPAPSTPPPASQTPSTPPPASQAPSTPPPASQAPSTPPPASHGLSTPPPSIPSTPPPNGQPPAGAYGPPSSSPYGGTPQPWQQGPPQTSFQGGGYPHPGGSGPPGSALPLRPARSPRKQAQVMTVLLSLLLLVHVIALTMDFVIDRALTNSPGDIASTPLSSINGYSGLKGATLALEIVSAPIAITMVVMWLVWFWRVRVNAETFAPGRIRYSAEMAVGAWLIPVCNLFVPKQVINDVWTASNPASPQWYGYGPRPTSRRGLVNGWWTMWLIYFVFGTFSSYESWYDAGTVEDGQETLALALFTDIFSIPAIILAMVLISRLTGIQDDKLAGR